MPFMVNAQRVEVYTDARGNNYFAFYAYGLPRDVVKTNAEMAASVNEWGIVRRHHTTKAVDAKIGSEGYDANRKISFAFAIAPENINATGQEDTDEWSAVVSWSQASGWDASLDSEKGGVLAGDNQYGIGDGEGNSTLAASRTGCAAYKGFDGLDNEGDWRLPTQREMQTMFTVIEQVLTLNEAASVQGSIASGDFWTSTEFYASDSDWTSWVNNSANGTVQANYIRSSANTVYARCIKDLFFTANGAIPDGKEAAAIQ